MGAQSWIKLGIQVQPGEFAKVTDHPHGCGVVARYGGSLDDLREYLKLSASSGAFLGIMTQPDLGTGLVYLCNAARWRLLQAERVRSTCSSRLALGIAAIAAVFAIDQLIYNSTGEYKLLKQYQRNRLLVFHRPRRLEHFVVGV